MCKRGVECIAANLANFHALSIGCVRVYNYFCNFVVWAGRLAEGLH